MSDAKELQDEEREALISIYEGDEAFKQLSPITFQYKYGKDDESKSFLVEIIWHENYPMELPKINMDTFFNRNLIISVKDKIKSVLEEEGNQWLGCGMTYTLFECLKDRIDELVQDQPDLVTSVDTLNVDGDDDDDDTINRNDNNKTTSNNNGNKKIQKKEQLTKAQKRRQWERTDHKGERPRGWNWVDIVKHLSQTGHKDEGSGGSGGGHTTNPSSSISGYSGAS